MEEADGCRGPQSALSALFWTHVNLYGRFLLDMDKRLDLDARAA
ncbi:hypothetical protein [Saccharopolyspora sp. 5N708]